MTLENVDISSPYKRAMLNAIHMQVKDGFTTFTQEQLAAQMGRKVTQAFRRRITELEREGIVQRFTYLGEKNGMKVAYQVVERYVQMPLPEFPF